MHPLRTAILEHTTANGVHHDWLIEDPTLSDPKAHHARLWTARVTPPPGDWPSLQRFDLTILPPHRRHYLTYQGPVSGDRGKVKRLASGTCYATLWSASRIILNLQLRAMTLDLHLYRRSDEHWLAVRA